MTSTTTSATHGAKKIKTDQASSTLQKARQPKEAARSKKTLSDGKSFGGSVGRMTNAMMYKMSEMYGLAIRQGSTEGQGNNH
jgi:hypothetical protein